MKFRTPKFQFKGDKEVCKRLLRELNGGTIVLRVSGDQLEGRINLHGTFKKTKSSSALQALEFAKGPVAPKKVRKWA